MLVGSLNEQMWFSTANRLNDIVSSKKSYQVSVLENINTFVHFLKLFECHSVNYLLLKQLSDKVYDQAFTVC